MSKDQKEASTLSQLSTSLPLSESCSETHLKNGTSRASSLYSMDTSLTLSDWLTLLQPILQKCS
ncbi:hypothetical protein HMI55_004779 [Coelomomyces lativittatus]|nr:hypothetical protein HMI55_004779 [Coelomomyces lativittatus]